MMMDASDVEPLALGEPFQQGFFAQALQLRLTELLTFADHLRQSRDAPSPESGLRLQGGGHGCSGVMSASGTMTHPSGQGVARGSALICPRSPSSIPQRPTQGGQCACLEHYGWFRCRFETDTRWRSTSHFRRSRRALDLAFRCQGARTAVQSGVRRDRESTDTERVEAATFSSTIREYSAGEHLPRAIICPRRPIVSQDANAISIIIKGNGTDFLWRRFLMVGGWGPTVGAARSAASSRRTAIRDAARRHDLTLVSFASVCSPIHTRAAQNFVAS
jgi:hypothetical protein